MIEAFEKRYGPVKLQQVPCGDDAQEISTSGPLLMEEAKLYRSLVGSGIYLSQERIEVSVHHQAAGKWYGQSIERSFAGDEKANRVPQEHSWSLQPSESSQSWTRSSSPL